MGGAVTAILRSILLLHPVKFNVLPTPIPISTRPRLNWATSNYKTWVTLGAEEKRREEKDEKKLLTVSETHEVCTWTLC